MHFMLRKGQRSHSLYTSVLFVLSLLKLYVYHRNCRGMFYCLCSGFVELNVLVQVQDISSSKYNNFFKNKWNMYTR